MSETKLDSDGETASARTCKVPYSTPALVVYGTVMALTQGSLSAGTDNPSAGKDMTQSDPALKENIVAVGSHPLLGIGLYLFDYKAAFRDACGHGRQFGVMADEVEVVMPEAVSVHANSYKQVDYAMLGIVRP